MRDSIDRLENIKARYPRLDIRSDTGWLIAEVERLRKTVAVLSGSEAMRAIAEGEKDV